MSRWSLHVAVLVVSTYVLQIYSTCSYVLAWLVKPTWVAVFSLSLYSFPLLQMVTSLRRHYMCHTGYCSQPCITKYTCVLHGLIICLRASQPNTIPLHTFLSTVPLWVAITTFNFRQWLHYIDDTIMCHTGYHSHLYVSPCTCPGLVICLQAWNCPSQANTIQLHTFMSTVPLWVHLAAITTFYSRQWLH